MPQQYGFEIYFPIIISILPYALIVAAAVTLLVLTKKSSIFSFTNVLFYIFLPAAIGLFVYVSSCMSTDGLCGAMSILPSFISKPILFISIAVSMLVPTPAFAVGAPSGLLIAALIRFLRSGSLTARA